MSKSDCDLFGGDRNPFDATFNATEQIRQIRHNPRFASNRFRSKTNHKFSNCWNTNWGNEWMSRPWLPSKWALVPNGCLASQPTARPPFRRNRSSLQPSVSAKRRSSLPSRAHPTTPTMARIVREKPTTKSRKRYNWKSRPKVCSGLTALTIPTTICMLCPHFKIQTMRASIAANIEIKNFL